MIDGVVAPVVTACWLVLHTSLPGTNIQDVLTEKFPTCDICRASIAPVHRKITTGTPWVLRSPIECTSRRPPWWPAED